MLSAALLLLLSCRSSDVTSKPSPDAFLEIGEGGGVMGIYTGYQLWGTGVLLHWQQQRLHRTIDTVTHIPGEHIVQWFQRADSLHLQELQIRETGNYQYWLQYRKAGDTVRIQWTDPQQIPAAVWQFYQDIKSFAQQQSGQ